MSGGWRERNRRRMVEGDRNEWRMEGESACT